MDNYANVFPATNVEPTVVDSITTDDVAIPDGPFVIVMDDFGTPELVGSRGVEVIKLDADNLDPDYAWSKEEFDKTEKELRRAIALLGASDSTDAQNEILEELRSSLDRLPELRKSYENGADDLD